MTGGRSMLGQKRRRARTQNLCQFRKRLLQLEYISGSWRGGGFQSVAFGCFCICVIASPHYLVNDKTNMCFIFFGVCGLVLCCLWAVTVVIWGRVNGVPVFMLSLVVLRVGIHGSYLWRGGRSQVCWHYVRSSHFRGACLPCVLQNYNNTG